MPIPKLTPILLPDGKFIIWAPARYTSTGKRRKLTFQSLKEAERWRDNFLKEVNQLGERANALSLANQEDVALAYDHLSRNGFSASLLECARLYVEQMSRFRINEKVEVVWELYYKDTLAQTSSKSVRSRLNILWECMRRHYALKAIGTLDVVTLKGLITQDNPTPAMFNNRLKSLKAFCNYAVKYSYLERSPVAAMGKLKTEENDIVILTVDQTKSMLEACEEWQHIVAIFLFSGIRGAELARMTWDDIEEEEHHVIRVRAKNSKSGAFRLIDIQSTLQRFLDVVPPERKTGKIIPKEWPRIWKDIRQKSGTSDAKNQCRHSYASYLLASCNDVNYVRSQLGHDTKDILFEHYRALVYKKDAEKYWGIVPK